MVSPDSAGPSREVLLCGQSALHQALMETHSPARPLTDVDLKDLHPAAQGGGQARMLATTGAPLKVRVAVPNPTRCLGEPPSRQEAREQGGRGAPQLRALLSLVSTGNGLTAKKLCTVISSSITAQAEVSRK